MKVVNELPFNHILKAAVIAHLASVKGTQREIPFVSIRAAIAASETDLPDGVIHQIALDAGYKVEP